MFGFCFFPISYSLISIVLKIISLYICIYLLLSWINCDLMGRLIPLVCGCNIVIVAIMSGAELYSILSVNCPLPALYNAGYHACSVSSKPAG